MLWWTIMKLKFGGPKAREDAASRLGYARDRRAVGALITTLRNTDEDKAVRFRAAMGLGDIVERESEKELVTIRAVLVEPLVAMLTDPNEVIRSTVASLLGELRDKRAVEGLGAALKEARPRPADHLGACPFAAEALGKIGGPRAVELLVGALEDPDRRVREEAADGLDGLGWKPANNRERALRAIVGNRFEEVKRIGEAAIEPLLGSLAFVGVALTLGEMAGEREVQPLVAALKNHDEDVRAGAAEALGWLARRGAGESVLQALNVQAVNPLVGALRDQSAYVRKRAAEALGCIRDPRAVRALADYRKREKAKPASAA